MGKILAIIPARSGSKGIEDKNVKILQGKPLIAYTIEAALKSNIFEDVIVSTDSVKYKEIAEKYGAHVPFLRDSRLSLDTTATSEVIEDVLTQMEKRGKNYDSFMLLQPTSPFRDAEDIKNAFKIFMKKEANCVVSVSECETPPQLIIELDDESQKLDGFLSNLKSVRRQDLKKGYKLNGAIYLCKSKYFLKYKNFYKEKSYAYIMEPHKSIDIDNEMDFALAEVMMNNKKK